MALALLTSAAGAEAKRPLQLGIFDGLFSSADAGERARWLDQAATERSQLALGVVTWSAVAPVDRGAGFNPSDPADPAYEWDAIDAFVSDASARGLDPILTVTRAPTWAEGKRRPAGADPGTWKPDPGDLRDFAQALATRYSGGFIPGGSGAALPRVRNYQAWTEPNLPEHLAPQWKGRAPKSPAIFRGLLNGFYAGVKSVAKSNRVITAGTSPYGDGPGGSRMRPLRFWREVLCLQDRRKLQPTRCPTKPRFDVLAHHPINTSGPPRQSAINPDDVSSPDLPSLQRTLHRAERAHHVLPAGKRPLWVTEFWWESKPPSKRGVNPRTQARYIAESLYLFWQAGAEVAVNLRIRDGERGEDEPGTGLYYLNGEPKPSAHAFRFPFVADRTGEGTLTLWGKAPVAGKVVVERKRGGKWQPATTLSAGGNRVFVGRMKQRGKAKLRARAGGESSLVWKQR